MRYADWMNRSRQIGTCSCDYGCPCEFNAPPTRLPCEGVMAREITEGHYGDVKLDGIKTAGPEQFTRETAPGGRWSTEAPAPIRNPVTGEAHHIAIRPHRGFEFREAEMASASFWSKGELDQTHSGRLAAMSFVSYGPQGIISEESFPNRSE